jgi:hypothetical protein
MAIAPPKSRLAGLARVAAPNRKTNREFFIPQYPPIPRAPLEKFVTLEHDLHRKSYWDAHPKELALIKQTEINKVGVTPQSLKHLFAMTMQQKCMLRDLLEKELQRQVARSRQGLKAAEYYMKGITLENEIDIIWNSWGITKEQSGWKPGSHASGRDEGVYSTKSLKLRRNNTLVSISGGRTTEHITLSDKLQAHEDGLKTFHELMGAHTNDSGKITLYFFPWSLFLSKEKDWEGTPTGWKTKKYFSSATGVHMHVAQSMSGQFWYKIDLTHPQIQLAITAGTIQIIK